jgi:hypothetical protein
LPSFTNEKEFKFGDKSVAGKMSNDKGESVGQILYPTGMAQEDEKIRRQYLLSHKSYQPGQQKSHYGPSWKRPKSPEMLNKKDDTNRVSTALFWGYEKDRFATRAQADISQITEPYHQPYFSVTSQSPHSNPDYTIYQLMGNSPPSPKKEDLGIKKWKLPPAGHKNVREDDLDLQKHIVPTLSANEDAKLTRKITEDKLGGSILVPSIYRENQKAYGLKSVKDAAERMGGLKGLADKTV